MLHSPREAKTTTTTTITYSKLASSISSTVQCVFVDVAKGRDSRNLSRRNMHFRARWPRPTDRPTWGSFAQMDGYKRRSQERSQSVRRSKEEGRGRCRKDHFDGHLETIQLCCGRTESEEGEKIWARMKEGRKELNWEQVRDGMRERLTVFHSLSKCGGRGIRYEH